MASIIFDEPLFDHSLMNLHEHTFKPYGSPTYRNSDVIRIPINFQDVIPGSYIYIEGKFVANDRTHDCYLPNNALAFLLDDIKYEMAGEKVATIRKPGIASTMKLRVSYGANQTTVSLGTGWDYHDNNIPYWM